MSIFKIGSNYRFFKKRTGEKGTILSTIIWIAVEIIYKINMKYLVLMMILFCLFSNPFQLHNAHKTHVEPERKSTVTSVSLHGVMPVISLDWMRDDAASCCLLWSVITELRMLQCTSHYCCYNRISAESLCLALLNPPPPHTHLYRYKDMSICRNICPHASICNVHMKKT